MNIRDLPPANQWDPGRLHPLSFADLRTTNVARCEEVFHPLESWSPTDWGTAVGGECGEALNLIKKGRRGEPVSVAAIATELADAVIYLDLLAARLGIDLGEAVTAKFNTTSRERKSTLFLVPRPANPGCDVNLVYQDDRADPPGGDRWRPIALIRVKGFDRSGKVVLEATMPRDGTLLHGRADVVRAEIERASE